MQCKKNITSFFKQFEKLKILKLKRFRHNTTKTRIVYIYIKNIDN